MRSLAEDLRARSDDQLAQLLVARPDLLHPVPADIAALARYAGAPASVAACLRGYDQLGLHVVLAAALGPDPIHPATLTRDVAAVVPGPGATSRVRAVVARMRADALLWGGRSLHLVGPARDLMIAPDRGPRVAALDPVVAEYARDPDSLRARLQEAPPGVLPALDRLLAGPVIGAVSAAMRTPVADRSPVDWLLAHHILIPSGADRAVLPAEVVAILRQYPAEDPARHVIDLAEPAPARAAPAPDRVDPGAVAAVLDVLHRCGELGRLWAAAPATKLRTGGISVRDVTRTARVLGAPEATAALLIEIAAAAGLLATDIRDQVSIVPTTTFDTWAGQPPSAQAAALQVAWLAMPRDVAEPGQHPLAPALAAATLPDLRRDVLRVLASADGSWTDDEVVEAVDWWAPRRHDATRADRVVRILAQCRELGLLVDGTLTSAGRAVTRPAAQVELALELSLPEQVDTLILQGDLTAIVPGLPTTALAELLRTMADSESIGAASTYRFSAASVRRALDSGRTAGELLGELRRRGDVPQPLAYLIEDVARRHAVLRIGSAATFLRCDDPTVVAGILADPGAAALGLLALSETVLVCEQPAELVFDRLRQLGHTPLAEPGRGPAAPASRRARAHPSAAESSEPAVTPALAAAAVRAVRANDRQGPAPDTGGRASTGPGGGLSAAANSARPASAASAAHATAHPIPAMLATGVAEVLRGAIADEASVWIGYADPAGVTGDRRVEPLRLAGGYLTALDARSQQITSFALARISGAQRA